MMKFLLNALARGAGYRISHGLLPNRFQAMPETLATLKRRGYFPQILLDGGANVGAWTRTARAVFPDASSHLFEPQPGCQPALRELARTLPRSTVHSCALTERSGGAVRMSGSGAAGTSTGAAVVAGGAAANDAIEVPAETLDSLVGALVAPSHRALLKLDLEGHELPALRGAVRLLAAVETVIAETQFYDVEGVPRPGFLALALHLRDAGFDLYDFASLSGRARDQRLVQCDAVFVRRGSPLLADVAWE